MPRTRARWPFLKELPTRLAEIATHEADRKPLRIWFADEARIGKKNKITRRWGPGRHVSFGATGPENGLDIRLRGDLPEQGKAASLVRPHFTTEALSLHPVEISQAVTPGTHAVLLLDQAGWHVSRKLKVPANITLLTLPAKAPELNPVQNIWQFMRENWISNRVFTSYTDILDHCCAAWNKHTDQPWTIMSTGLSDWTNARGLAPTGTIQTEWD